MFASTLSCTLALYLTAGIVTDWNDMEQIWNVRLLCVLLISSSMCTLRTSYLSCECVQLRVLANIDNTSKGT